MGDLDEISMLLGKLQAELLEASRQREAMFRKLDSLQNQVAEVSGAIKLQAENHATLQRQVINEIKPEVESFKALKNRGYGVIAVIGLSAGGLGAFLSSLVGAGHTN